jgi:hypothetical protein
MFVFHLAARVYSPALDCKYTSCTRLYLTIATPFTSSPARKLQSIMYVFKALFLLCFVSLRLAIAMPTDLVARDFDPYKLADDTTWSRYKCKGDKLYSAMVGTDAEAGRLMDLSSARSQWQGDLRCKFRLNHSGGVVRLTDSKMK